MKLRKPSFGCWKRSFRVKRLSIHESLTQKRNDRVTLANVEPEIDVQSNGRIGLCFLQRQVKNYVKKQHLWENRMKS